MVALRGRDTLAAGRARNPHGRKESRDLGRGFALEAWFVSRGLIAAQIQSFASAISDADPATDQSGRSGVVNWLTDRSLCTQI